MALIVWLVKLFVHPARLRRQPREPRLELRALLGARGPRGHEIGLVVGLVRVLSRHGT
jgi:hypothetical protein